MFFDFHNPTRLIFGEGSLARLAPELKRGSISRLLLVAGEGSIRRNGVYEKITHSLEAQEIVWSELWGVQPNPLLSKAEEGVSLAREAGAEAILALGGGSVLDTAKVIAAGLKREEIWSAFEEGRPINEALPIYTALTLSATGSEMNGYAVLTHDERRLKWGIQGPALYPKLSIIEPSVQRSLPWHQVVNGAIDALAHIQEAYFTAGDQELSLALAEALMCSIIGAVDRLQADFGDEQARASLAWGATLALNGMLSAGLPGDWASHGIEHSLSALHPRVAHGAGLGVIFPAWIRFVAPRKPQLFSRWAREVWSAGDLEEALCHWEARLKAWGAPTSLRDLGLGADDLEPILANLSHQRRIGRVQALGPRQLRAILEDAL